jgi:hypothetical protein
MTIDALWSRLTEKAAAAHFVHFFMGTFDSGGASSEGSGRKDHLKLDPETRILVPAR